MSLKTPWLTLCQIVFVMFGLLFVISTLKPSWLDKIIDEIERKEMLRFSLDNGGRPTLARVDGKKVISFKSGFEKAAITAIPSVVHILSKQGRARTDHPYFEALTLKKFLLDSEMLGENEKNSFHQSMGSGVIVASGGFVMTNYRVVKGATDLQVALTNGQKVAAEVIGVDPETDLAVLKITDKNAPHIIFARPNQIHIGDFVLAIGNPFGVGQTVTQGIVSALGRDSLNVNTFENFIQTDAAINPGNSGGALVNGAGELVGINTAIYSKTGSNAGIGFAIPVETVAFVFEEIIDEGRVTRGFIGVKLGDVSIEFSDYAGRSNAYVRYVVKNSPADRADVRPGDIILSLADLKIKNSKHFMAIVSNLEPSLQTNMKLKRGNKIIGVQISIAERPIFNK